MSMRSSFGMVQGREASRANLSKTVVWYIPWRIRPDNANRTNYSFRINIGTEQEGICHFSFIRSQSSRADAVIFFGGSNKFRCDRDALPPARSVNQIYIYDLGPEPAWWADVNYCLITESDWLDGFFNLTSGQGLRVDLFYTLKYPFEMMRISKNSSVAFMRQLYRGSKKFPVIWIASHCNTHSLRERYVKVFQKFIPIHVFGRCGNSSVCGPRLSPNCFPRIRSDYYFIIAFENSVCPGYNTEKLLTFGMQQAIPIVLKRSIASKLLPDSAFIAADDFSSPKDLAAHLEYLIRDETAYLSYFKWTEDLESHLQPIEPFDVQLCKWLHSHDTNVFHRSYSLPHLLEVFQPDQCHKNFAVDYLLNNQTTSAAWRREKMMKEYIREWDPLEGKTFFNKTYL